MPDISFIIPVYNVSIYLEKFFEGFRKCTLSCEIIFVNDGSTDSSAEVLKRLAKIDNRAIVFSKENGGVSSARNFGIMKSSGRYISCLDPDDIISPAFFSCIDLVLRHHDDVDTIIYDYIKFKDGTLPIYSMTDTYPPDMELIHKNALSKFHNYPWLRIVRREFYNDNPFPEGIIYEDSVTVPLLNAQADKVVRIKFPLYYYRVRNDSLTNFDVQRNMDLIIALDILELRVKKHPAYFPNLYSCVAHLSRSALITLFKISYTKKASGDFDFNKKNIFSKFNKYSLCTILKSNANLPDKLCFLLLKMNVIGFFVFKITYKIFNK